MKYRIGSLATLLVVGLLSSSAVLAGPNNHGYGDRPSAQRSAPPQRQAAPPPRQAHRAPPPRQVHRAPPQRHYAPPPRHVHRHAPPPTYSSHGHHGRAWQVGRPLPRTVVYQEVSAPHYSHYRLAPPPRNHRYVRVGDDILLIAIGTGLIASAIYNLSY